MWQLEFPAKLVRYLDLPQNFERGLGGRFYRDELSTLADELAARGAHPYDPDQLRRSIAAYNQNRRLVAEAYDLRRAEPWRVPTAELYLVLRAGLVLPVEEFSALLGDYLAAVRRDPGRKPMDQARVLLTGSFCEQPPLGLLKTLERAGCYIVDDDLVQVHRWIRGDIIAGADPLGSLADAFLDQSIASPTRYIGDDEKGRDLVERVARSGAEGVIFCAPSFCDPALLDQPMVVKAVERAGIPWTAFKYSENTGQFQVIREQAGTFADSIKLWSGA
jgi:benzoyl-CoA reductase subunit C